MLCYTTGVSICLCLSFFCSIFANHNNFVPEYKGNALIASDYDIVVPIKVSDTGKYMSHELPHFHKRSNNYEEAADKVHYLVSIAGEDHHLELLPNRKILSPGVVAESHNTNGLLENKIKRFRDNQCHFTGSVRGHANSRAAISTCDGLSGYIRTKRGYYTIEPMTNNGHKNDGHLHILQQHKDNELLPSCNTEPEASHIFKRSANYNDTSTNVSSLPELHIETLVVLDHTILEHHKETDIENYVLTVFNMAHDLFHDASLGTNINLAIVRLIRLEVEDHEMNVAINRNVNRTLEYFRKWQNKMNPKDDSHPNHHDVAVLLTRIDICGDEKSCGLLGAAKIESVCNPEFQAAICQDNGLRLGFIIAHEIGHTLGLSHDLRQTPATLCIPGKCYDELADGSLTVMSSLIGMNTLSWSECNKNQLKQSIESGFGQCLYDPPTDHSFVLVDALPGVMYDADFQCRELFGPNAALCMTGLECSNLICYIEDKGCVETHMAAAPGTNCGENKWCYEGNCTQIGERHDSVDGGWGEWLAWSECSRTCGSGVASQERHCDKPAPVHGGKYCSGEYRRHRICSTDPCDLDDVSFRDIQCAEFNSWLYPEDEKVHQWTNYPLHDGNPCELFCVNDLGNVAALRPRVIDGTTCYRGIRDICINGLCKEIPCDLDLNSHAVEDRCGVCKGDGTSCTIIEGENFFSCERQLGEQKFIEIPTGAVNIKIEEMTPSESHIEVRDKDGSNVFIAGDALGMFNVQGSKAWVGMIRTKQQAIGIAGPITNIIAVWIGVQENTTIKFSYGIKAKNKIIPKFSWDYLDWTSCSSECGPGIQEAISKCVENEAGLVDESFCKNITKLPEQLRPCEIAPCTTRWFIGDWQACGLCPWGTRSRIVKCFRPTGEGEGEIDIVQDIECAPPKPKTSESCTCTKITRSSSKKDKHKEKFGKTNRECKNSTDRTIVDMENLDSLKIIVHTELEGSKYPPGIPHPKYGNASTYSMEGKEAMKFLNTVQKQIENNKTKI